MASWSFKATGDLNTAWPYVIAGAGSLLSALFLGERLPLAALIGVPLGMACVLIARDKAAIQFHPEPTNFAEFRRQYVFSKLFFALFGIAFAAAAYFAPEENFSGGLPGRALMMFLGGMSLGIGTALPLRPKDGANE